MERNDSFCSQSEEDITSLESYESFDDAYDRITKITRNEKDIVLEHQASICPTTFSNMMVVAMCFIVCASVPILVVTLYEQPPSTTDLMDTTSPPAVCAGRFLESHHHPSLIFL